MEINLCQIPHGIVENYIRSHPARSMHVQEGKVASSVLRWRSTVDLTEMNLMNGWMAQKAHSDKSVYYSFYMHVIIQMIIPVFGCVKAVMYEAIYATALTMSQLGLKKGVEYAIRKRGNGKMLLLIGLRD